MRPLERMYQRALELRTEELFLAIQTVIYNHPNLWLTQDFVVAQINERYNYGCTKAEAERVMRFYAQMYSNRTQVRRNHLTNEDEIFIFQSLPGIPSNEPPFA